MSHSPAKTCCTNETLPPPAQKVRPMHGRAVRAALRATGKDLAEPFIRLQNVNKLSDQSGQVQALEDVSLTRERVHRDCPQRVRQDHLLKMLAGLSPLIRLDQHRRPARRTADGGIVFQTRSARLAQCPSNDGRLISKMHRAANTGRDGIAQ
jgi:hypothetical protein